MLITSMLGNILSTGKSLGVLSIPKKEQTRKKEETEEDSGLGKRTCSVRASISRGHSE